VGGRLLVALAFAGAAAASELGLPVRVPLAEPRGNLFATPRRPAPPLASAGASRAAPEPPPMPYRVAGTLVHDGASSVLLATHDELLRVTQGDSLDGGYRVESVAATEITLVYLPTGRRYRLPR
jgi:hypothetical protein